MLRFPIETSYPLLVTLTRPISYSLLPLYTTSCVYLGSLTYRIASKTERVNSDC
jgi:hypothetical protein